MKMVRRWAEQTPWPLPQVRKTVEQLLKLPLPQARQTVTVPPAQVAAGWPRVPCIRAQPQTRTNRTAKSRRTLLFPLLHLLHPHCPQMCKHRMVLVRATPAAARRLTHKLLRYLLLRVSAKPQPSLCHPRSSLVNSHHRTSKSSTCHRQTAAVSRRSVTSLFNSRSATSSPSMLLPRHSL